MQQIKDILQPDPIIVNIGFLVINVIGFIVFPWLGIIGYM